MIFRRVADGRPYPDHGLTQRDWADVSPTQVHLADLTTTKTQLDLAHLLDEDSTYFGDLFAHCVAWEGELFLEDGLHRAVRAALQQRGMLHARVHTIQTAGSLS
ncbi:type II toxin-antitoxin system VapB family antitoxin [Aeromicrobium sp. CTD01-1L150]|uniref:type II toxin-antitoxin system VapB family antitoxin n=1 Tax=Aeromicrobium sp. CTD01-1L150 TaxID=3341830 RepID=UPI0035C1E11D